MPTRTGCQEDMMHRRDILEPARARRGHANLLPWSQDVLANCKSGCWRSQDEVLAPLQKRPLERMMQGAHLVASSWAHASLRAAACPLEVRPAFFAGAEAAARHGCTQVQTHWGELGS